MKSDTRGVIGGRNKLRNCRDFYVSPEVAQVVILLRTKSVTQENSINCLMELFKKNNYAILINTILQKY